MFSACCSHSQPCYLPPLPKPQQLPYMYKATVTLAHCAGCSGTDPPCSLQIHDHRSPITPPRSTTTPAAPLLTADR
jgi:hypothetical protein